MRIGFLGLGNMGSPMALRLLASGYELHVYDPNSAAMSQVEEKGASTADSPKDIGDLCDIVLCSLPTPPIVKEALCGASGIIHGGRVEVIIDLSTTGIEVAREVAAALEAGGKIYVDAPVSGGVAGAAAGTLAIMASTPGKVFEKICPILSVLGGEKVFHVGEVPGLGQVMKLANNMLSAIILVGSFEALIMGAKAGLDVRKMIEVLKVSSGTNDHLFNKIPNSVLNREFPNNFPTNLMLKDLRLANQSAHELGVPLILGNAVQDFLAFSATQGMGQVDWANTVRHFEEWAKIELHG